VTSAGRTRRVAVLASTSLVVAAALLAGAALDDASTRWWYLLGGVVVTFAAAAFQLTLVRFVTAWDAERAALAAALLLRLLTVLFGPAAAVLERVSGVLAAGRGTADAPLTSEDELRALIDQAGEGEVIEQEEARLMSSVLEFTDTIVREVMVPRPDMVALSSDASIEEALTVAVEHGFSRIPVYGRDLDDILGLLYVKDLLRTMQTGQRDAVVGDVVRPAHFVPEQKRTAELLADMQNDKFHLAIVVDEYGGTAGLVTIEDLLEELVGEITDEYDTAEELARRGPHGELRVRGRMSLGDLGELLNQEVSIDDADTVGGALLALLGRIPAVGEQVHDPDSGITLRAASVSGRRVEEVDVILPAESAQA
jgi:putative hemolysin